MKNSQTETLRKFIQEEVRKAVADEVYKQFPALISEIMQSGNSPTPKQKKPLQEAISKKQRNIITGNRALDSVLSETSGFDQSHYSASDHGVSIDGAFSMSSGGQVPVYKAPSIPTTDTEGRPVDIGAIPDFLKASLTKNYSSLLKKVDKLSKQNTNVQVFSEG